MLLSSVIFISVNNCDNVSFVELFERKTVALHISVRRGA